MNWIEFCHRTVKGSHSSRWRCLKVESSATSANNPVMGLKGGFQEERVSFLCFPLMSHPFARMCLSHTKDQNVDGTSQTNAAT